MNTLANVLKLAYYNIKIEWNIDIRLIDKWNHNLKLG
jgi:hypothetical protein